MQRSYDYVFKICFLGQAGVGKTALMRRYADDAFEENMLPTIGVDFRFKSINVGKSFVKLQLWDTAGQQRFRSVIESYYRDADAVILVYDVGNKHSFQMMEEYWLEVVKKNIKSQSMIFAFANKSEGKQRLGQEERGWFDRQRIRCFQVSAKTGKGVGESINAIVQALIQTHPKIESQKMVMTLNEYNPPKKKGCCR